MSFSALACACPTLSTGSISVSVVVVGRASVCATGLEHVDTLPAASTASAPSLTAAALACAEVGVSPAPDSAPGVPVATGEPAHAAVLNSRTVCGEPLASR